MQDSSLMNTDKMLKVETNEERNLYREMKIALDKHNSYYVRKTYYPYRMDAWETQKRAIEFEYRSKIHALINDRKQEEMLMKQQANEDEIENAATTLLKLKHSLPKKKNAYSLKSVNDTNVPIRRSTRIMNQNKNKNI